MGGVKKGFDVDTHSMHLSHALHYALNSAMHTSLVSCMCINFYGQLHVIHLGSYPVVFASQQISDLMRDHHSISNLVPPSYTRNRCTVSVRYRLPVSC